MIAHLTFSVRLKRSGRLLVAFIFGLGLLLILLADLHGVYASPTASKRFVATTGNDGGGTSDCLSFNHPCRTVQQAVNVASDGDMILVATGIYTGVQAHAGVTQVVYIGKNLILRGGYTPTLDAYGWTTPYPLTQPTTLDALRQGRVVYMEGNVTPTLDGFILANGNATGLTAHCESQADGCGGGILVYNAHPIIMNNIITNNIAALTTLGYPTGTTGYGGGLFMNGATRAVISGNLIISNVGSLANCGGGGGIYLFPAGNMLSGLQVLSNQIISNTATTTNLGCAWGGGIQGGPDGVLIQGNVIAGNQANRWGGGQGAGLFQWYGSATYLNNLIKGNLGNVSGQAVFLGYSRSRFEGNQVVDNSTLYGIQLAVSEGSGSTLINNVVARSGDKTLAAVGGAGYPVTATLLHNTLIGSGSGSGVYVESDYVTLFLTNTIIVSHTWGITNTSPASSTVLADHTLFWANTHNGIQGSHSLSGNPVFAADGYHLGVGSAAIDTGVVAGILNDIDGDPRPDGPGFDIGADEAQLQHVYLPLITRN